MRGEEQHEEPKYENFFVCNYGVGGNVLGEPVFECDVHEEEEKEGEKEEGMPPMFRTLEIAFAENLPLADESVRTAIRRCLDAIACVREHEDCRRCAGVVSRCSGTPGVPLAASEGKGELARLAECRIEFVLCRLSDPEELCQGRLEACSGPRGAATPPSTTTTSRTPLPVTTATKVISAGGEAMVGSSSLGSQEEEEKEVDEAEASTPPSQTDADGSDQPARPFTPPFVTTTEFLDANTDVAEEGEAGGRIDLAHYGSAPRGAVRLALCLEAARCQGGAGCRRARAKCAEGFDVSGLPTEVGRKLSECFVEDILCHLSGAEERAAEDCRTRFAACADVVLPEEGVRVVAAQPPPETESGERFFHVQAGAFDTSCLI